jgi:DNA ligase-1
MLDGFKPMLSAKDFDLEQLIYPLMCSDKYDGIRNCQIPGLGGVSRKVEPIPNLALRAYLDRPELDGLDGELIYGSPTEHKIRQKTQGAWARIEGPHPDSDPARPLDFYVFDDFSDPSLPKLARYTNAKARVEALNDPHIKLIVNKLVHNAQEAYEAQKDAERRGFEGIMLADPNGLYKFGRATASYDKALKKQGIFRIPLALGKVKSFLDEEGEIVGYEEEMHNANEATTDALGHTKRSTHKENKVGKGTLGAFIVRNPKYPKTFKVGSGFTADQRKEFWRRREALLGDQITYRYQPSGMDQVPQFTVFVDFRLD